MMYTLYIISRTTKKAPSKKEMTPPRIAAYRSDELPIVTGQSRRNVSNPTRIGPMIAVIPKTSPRLQMFEPTTLPMARSGLPESADFNEISNSGTEVPKATIVKPTTNGEMCSRRAMLDAPFTRKSAPTMSTTRPLQTKIRLAAWIRSLVQSLSHRHLPTLGR